MKVKYESETSDGKWKLNEIQNHTSDRKGKYYQNSDKKWKSNMKMKPQMESEKNEKQNHTPDRKWKVQNETETPRKKEKT